MFKLTFFYQEMIFFLIQIGILLIRLVPLTDLFHILLENFTNIIVK
jgi:hypothetical protein